MTCQPVRPCEIDIDSEDENDPEWLCQKTQQVHCTYTFSSVGRFHYDFSVLCISTK